MIYSQIEPFGEGIANWRAAMLARTMAEIHRDHNRRSKPFQIEEFMPKADEEEDSTEPKTLEQLMEIGEILSIITGWA